MCMQELCGRTWVVALRQDRVCWFVESIVLGLAHLDVRPCEGRVLLLAEQLECRRHVVVLGAAV